MSSSEDSKKLVKLLLGLIFLLIELVEIVDALRRLERLKFDVDDVTRGGGPTAGEKTESSAEHLSLEDSKKVASAFSMKDDVEPTGRVLTDNNDCRDSDFRILIVFRSRLFLSRVAPRQLGSRGTGISLTSGTVTVSSSTSTSGTPGTSWTLSLPGKRKSVKRVGVRAEGLKSKCQQHHVCKEY